jgi:hypothetical protein
VCRPQPSSFCWYVGELFRVFLLIFVLARKNGKWERQQKRPNKKSHVEVVVSCCSADGVLLCNNLVEWIYTWLGAGYKYNVCLLTYYTVKSTDIVRDNILYQEQLKIDLLTKWVNWILIVTCKNKEKWIGNCSWIYYEHILKNGV